MKYSIRGSLNTADGSAVVGIINQYTLWRFITEIYTDVFTFEAWVNTSSDKTALWNQLIPQVDLNTGSIDWHECTHDEQPPQPCVIAGTYTK